jgi:type IV pilus assembly protein PilB
VNERIGELLVKENLLSAEQLAKAREESRSKGGRLGSQITGLGFLDESELSDFVAKQYGVPSINLDEFEIENAVIQLIPEEVATKHTVIPVNRAGSTLILATSDPSNIFALDDIKFLTGYSIQPVVTSEDAIRRAIDKYYDQTSSLEDVMGDFDDSDIDLVHDEDDLDIGELAKASEDAPVVKLVNLILTDAVKKSASDIHVEPYEKTFRVRYRIDGVLYEVMKPPIKLKNAIISRLKIMSELDIAERRLPQDGRIKLKMGRGREMDFRVSVLPTLYGEKVVLRLLDKSNLQLDMTKLGFEQSQLDVFKNSIHQPFGMVLVTGPTGSGKTTSLYSALSELNRTSENLSTAEDPVEFNLEGINQVQMHEEIGLNFAAALRSFLRQDPDIIMVGEIRDFETAEIAVKAALTGHMVLSTLHTNDAPSTVNRLLNMGVEPFLVASSVNCIVAQRLARCICEECKERDPEVTSEALVEAGMSQEDAAKVAPVKGKGCRNCSDTGFKGRIAVYEVMELKEELKEFVLNGASALELKREANRLGMQTLRESALTKLAEGRRPTTRRAADGEHAPVPEGDDREGRQRPSYHHGNAAAAPDRWEAASAQAPAADAAGDQAALLFGAHRRPEASLRRGQRARPLLQRAEALALSWQRLRAAGQRRGSLSGDPVPDQEFRRAGPAQGGGGARGEASWAGPRHRADGLGEVHDARHHHRQDQPGSKRAHHHDRGPDRVPAPAQELRGEPARSGRRYGELQEGPEVHPAPGPRCGADR